MVAVYEFVFDDLNTSHRAWFYKMPAVIIVGSILAGMLIYDVFKKNREIQQWAFKVLIVKIPLFTFVGVYLFAFIYGILNEF